MPVLRNIDQWPDAKECKIIMGMSLQPANDPKLPAVDYNWRAWVSLNKLLIQWGVNVSELRGDNDGGLISPETCMAISKAIRNNWSKLLHEDMKMLWKHEALWIYLGQNGGALQK